MQKSLSLNINMRFIYRTTGYLKITLGREEIKDDGGKDLGCIQKSRSLNKSRRYMAAEGSMCGGLVYLR